MKDFLVLHFKRFSFIRLIFFVLFSSRINVPSTILEFSSGENFGSKICNFVSYQFAILFPINSSVASAFFWTTFLKAFIAALSPVVVAIFNGFLPYLLEKYLENQKHQ